MRKIGILAFLILALALPSFAQHYPVASNIAPNGKILYEDYASSPDPQVVVIQKQVVIDYQCIPTPGNPPTGNIRVYCDSGTGNLACLTSSGASCISASGGSSFPVTTAVTVNSGGSITPSGTGTITASALTSGVSVTPNLQAWYISNNCGNLTNCTKINADAVILTDCTATNASSTITCPDAIFTSADVGKSAWVTTAQPVSINATIVCPISTISTVNSTTSITLAAANDCTSSLSSTAALFFGTKDGTAIANAMSANGGNFVFTVGNSRVGGVSRILVDQPFGNTLLTIAGSTNISPFITVSGGTPSSSSAYFVITPDFNWAGCTGNNGTLSNVCFLSQAINASYLSWGGFGLNGTGSCTGASGKTVVAPATLVNQNPGLNLNGICPGTLNLVGYEIDGFDSGVSYGGVINAGTTSCAIGGVGTFAIYNDCINDGLTVTGNACAASTLAQCSGLWVKPAAQFQDFGSVWLENVVNQGNFQARNSHFYASASQWAIINSNSGGVARFLSDGDFFNETSSPAGASSFGILNDFGAQVYLHNSAVKAGASGIALENANDGAVVNVFDQCGVTYSGGTLYTNVGGAGKIFGGACSGNTTAVTAAKLVLSAGWGSTAAVTALSGADAPIQFTITNSGTGQGAAPTITYTFPTAYLIAPMSCTATQVGGTNATNTFTSSSLTSTGVVFTTNLTPTAASTEIVQVSCVIP